MPPKYIVSLPARVATRPTRAVSLVTWRRIAQHARREPQSGLESEDPAGRGVGLVARHAPEASARGPRPPPATGSASQAIAQSAPARSARTVARTGLMPSDELAAAIASESVSITASGPRRRRR